MPSLRARLLSGFLRLHFKRRPPADEAQFVRLMRSKMQPPEFLRPPVPKSAVITPVNISSNGDGVRGEWIAWQGQTPQRTIYYLHGGGYIACSPATHRAFSVALARAAEARVFMLDYRLAPEHRFPAPVEDAVAAYRWLLAQGEQPDNMLIGGESAGGRLTIATLVALRDAGLPLPKAAFVVSPWTDMTGSGASAQRNEKTDPMFYTASVHKFAQAYLGTASPMEPLASPLQADLSGLPPLLIYASASECLLDDAVQLAERAKQFGVEAELQTPDGLMHVWPLFVGMLPEAAETIQELGAFARQHCGGRN